MGIFNQKLVQYLTENIFCSRTEFTYDEVKMIFDQLVQSVGINMDVMKGTLEHPESVKYAETKMPQLVMSVNTIFAKKGILKRYREDLIKDAGYKTLVDICDDLDLWKETVTEAVDHVSLGNCPYEEKLEIGSKQDNFENCKKYKEELKKKFKDTLKPGMTFSIQPIPSEHGEKFEVVLLFNNDDDEHIEISRQIEENLPTNWSNKE